MSLATDRPRDETRADDPGGQFWNQQGSAAMTLRTREEIVRFFDGTDLVEPGVVSCSRWRPEQVGAGEIGDVTHLCGVARKR
jgi:S-adenosyl methyltransferase